MSILEAPAPVVEAAPEIPVRRPQDDWPSWCDDDVWTIREDGPSPTWEAAPYTPCDDDWREYSAWSRSIDPGVPTAALTVEECDLLAHSVPDRQFREMLQDELADRYAEGRP